MEYTLAIENTPDSVPGGTGILLVHPSTVETDRIDTEFLKTDTDNLFIVSTRTTAREVKQKLEHYEVDESRATILDALSAERGYTRRQSNSVHYLPAANDLDGIVEETGEFLDTHEGKRRVSIDSITEMIYYADKRATHEAVEALLDLLVQHDAVGIFHLAAGVHDDELVSQFRELFGGVVELDETGTISSSF